MRRRVALTSATATLALLLSIILYISAPPGETAKSLIRLGFGVVSAGLISLLALPLASWIDKKKLRARLARLSSSAAH